MERRQELTGMCLMCMAYLEEKKYILAHLKKNFSHFFTELKSTKYFIKYTKIFFTLIQRHTLGK